MKLREVKHTEKFCGKMQTSKFDFHNNRFCLFDKYGNELNSFSMEKVPNVLDLEVLETKTSGYWGYGVGFPVTHIRLNYTNEDIVCSWGIKFGEEDTRL